MLRSLHIQNFLLISELALEFDTGLTVLTGETGAGKSIIVNALGILLGDRAETSLINSECDQAVLEAIFVDSENQEILVRREINRNGRNNVKVNGNLATQAMLKGMTEELIEIHGQHDQQTLFDNQKQLLIMDRYGQEGTRHLIEAYQSIFELWQELSATLDEKTKQHNELTRDEDYLRFQLAELERIDLENYDEVALVSLRNRLKNEVKLKSNLQELQTGIERVQDIIGSWQSLLQGVAEVEPKLASAILLYKTISDLIGELQHQVMSIDEDWGGETLSLDEVDERLFMVRNLQKKFGSDLRVAYQNLRSKLDALACGNQELTALHQKLEQVMQDISVKADLLSKQRYATARKLEKLVELELAALEMPKARFSIRFDKVEFGQLGQDRVEFMISANPGEPQGPIRKVASGGELSRMMLALKVVLGQTLDQRGMIFDEIDSGIGGETATSVGLKLQALARERQVLCVTHLPQIAAFAAYQFRVDKTIVHKQTRVTVYKVEKEARVRELARMLGNENDPTTQLLAKKLLGHNKEH